MAQQNFQDYDPLDDYARRTNSVREKLSFLITRVSVPFALVTQCISESLAVDFAQPISSKYSNDRHLFISSHFMFLSC